MSGNTNGATAPDDGSGIPADLLADEDAGLGAPTAEEAAARQAEAEKQELRDHLRAQGEMIRQLNSRLEAQATKQDQILSHSKSVDERSREAAERGWQFAYDEAWQAIDRATENADKEALVRAKANLAMVMKHQPASVEASAQGQGQQQQQPAQVDPEVAAWVDANPWFNTDLTLRGTAIGLYEEMLKAKPGVSTKDRLAEMKASVIKRFPEKFPTQAQPRNGAPTVSRPGPQGNARLKPKEPTLADLDEDDRAALAAIKRVDPNFKDETYLKGRKTREERQKELNRL